MEYFHSRNQEADTQLARPLITSRPISVGSVACSSTWIPSSSLLNLSLELAYSILLLIFAVSGALHITSAKEHRPMVSELERYRCSNLNSE